MNKSKLIEALSSAGDVPAKKAAELVDLILEEMSAALKRGERIEIRGLGSFVVKEYATYLGRNPRSKETIVVGKKRLPCFKVGKELRARINGEPYEDDESSSSVAGESDLVDTPASPGTPENTPD